jgi:hypothetical protein
VDASQPRNLAPDLPERLKRKPRWLLNRLRCMTPLEVAHRLLRALQAHAGRSALLGGRDAPAPDLAAPFTAWIRPAAALDAPAYLAAADRIAEGCLDVFALRNVNLGQPPRWNRDPKTGIDAPLRYGKTLDYRDPDLVGDIKYLWEPNRHVHLVTLAQAWALSGDGKYLRYLAVQLESWFVSCPYPLGPNWASSLEAAIRLINWSIVWQLIGGADASLFRQPPWRELRARWLRSVHQHAQFVRGWLSLHSSANNHLIGEAAGLYIAGLTWPHWRASARWLRTGKKILEREALAQNAPDGVNREQAVSYQQFVLDLLLFCLLAGRAGGQPFSADYESRLEAMLDYLASIMDAGGNVPMFGDADDGRVFRLSPQSHCPYRSLLATGAVLFRRGDFKRKAGGLDDKTRWLLGPQADRQYAELDAEKTRTPMRQSFPDGGYFVLGCKLDTPQEIRLVADAGPLGYRSIAAHGHADALSFTLSVGGLEFLVDPGTYAYHTQGAWRQYFRGTSAHNTVRIDGLDQSEQGGNFLWLKKANVGCSLWRSSAQKDSFAGWHDGYARLEDPVKHARLIELDKLARRVLIEDTLDMVDEHRVELFFHCHEACSVEATADGFALTRERTTLRLVLPQAGNARTQLFHGSLAPMSGWISRSFDSRLPAPTVMWSAALRGRALLRSEIRVSCADAPSGILSLD